MAFFLLIAGAAAAAQPGGAHHAPAAHVDAAQAKAEGYAEAQRALAGQDNLTPDALAASLAGRQSAAPAQPGTPPAATTPVESSAQLNLTCVGAGTADKQRGSFISGRYGWASLVSHHDRQFEDQVDVRLFGGDDRIRIPRTMLPGIHGGADGWFKLKDVVADARSIHAHAAVSAFHNPQVYIDRMTGTISISGKDGDYSGQCQAVQADAPAKF